MAGRVDSFSLILAQIIKIVCLKWCLKWNLTSLSQFSRTVSQAPDSSLSRQKSEKMRFITILKMMLMLLTGTILYNPPCKNVNARVRKRTVLIGFSFQGYRCKSGIAIIAWRVTLHYMSIKLQHFYENPLEDEIFLCKRYVLC